MSESSYHDARIIAPYNSDELHYLTPLTFTLGKNAKADAWEPSKGIAHVRALFDVFARHPEGGSKDGLAFVSGELIPGPRNKTAAKAMHALTFDFDRGTAPALIDAAFLKLGCAFLRYTSFSNGKTRSEFSRDAVCKFLKCNKSDLDTEALRRYVRGKEKWVEEIAATVELIEVKQVSGGFKCFVSHAPLHKNRVVVPLAAPFVIDDFENLQDATAKWNAIYFGVAESNGLLDHIDRTGADLNRLFYFPRHPKGGAHDTVIAGGPLLDVKALDFSNPYLDAASELDGTDKTAKSKTDHKLGGWWRTYKHRSQIADLLREETDKVRGPVSSGVTIECPFDSEHSNAGDPNDSGCFAVNAGDGRDTVFVRCQHDSCRGYTTLDHVARMIADGWFARDVLDDDNYNAMVVDAAPVASPVKPGWTDLAIIMAESKGKRKKRKPKKSATVDADTEPATENMDATETEDEVVVADGYGGALAFDKDLPPPPKGVTYNKESGQIHPTYRNALLLIGSERWDLGYNELTQNYGLRGEVEYPWPAHLGYALNDAIRREIRLYMLRRWGVTLKTEDVYEATMTLARRNTFNPVCDYLNEVEGLWDGAPRVDRWLETYMGVTITDENRDYVRAIGKIILTAAARRAREPGSKFDEILILEGDQGAGKSTALRVLGGEWFSDSNLGDLKNKSAPMKLRGVWIHEIAELTALNRAETNELKEFTSQQIDRYRLPYAKSEDDFPRRCVFIGTVNPGGGAYLVDLTGNRRFWPVACGKIDLEALARDRDQLWAEAAMMESRGDAIRLDPSLYDVAKKEQEARLADDPWRDILIDHLDAVNPTKEKVRRVTSNALLTLALQIPNDKLTQAHTKRLKGVMATVENWTYKASLRADGEKTAGYEYVGA